MKELPIESTVNDRLQAVVDEFYSGKAKYLARDANVPLSSISSILGERQSKPSLETIKNIYFNALQQYNISLKWLAFGEGNAKEDTNDDSSDQHQPTLGEQGVPYYEDIDVAASIKGMYSDNGETPSFFINYRDFNDCTAYLPVVGDSMYPRYASGEIIAVKRIYNLDVVLWGEAYLIVTNSNANDLRTIKLIHQHEDESKIILKASNPNFKGETIINKSDIVSLFLIKGKIVRNQL